MLFCEPYTRILFAGGFLPNAHSQFGKLGFLSKQNLPSREASSTGGGVYVRDYESEDFDGA